MRHCFFIKGRLIYEVEITNPFVWVGLGLPFHQRFPREVVEVVG